MSRRAASIPARVSVHGRFSSVSGSSLVTALSGFKMLLRSCNVYLVGSRLYMASDWLCCCGKVVVEGVRGSGYAKLELGEDCF